MGSEWQDIRFGDILTESIRSGVYKSKEYHGEGSKVVNMGELFAYPRLYSIPMQRVSITEAEKEKTCLLPGDLLFARRSLVAEGAGKCSIILTINEETTFESSIIRARPNKRYADSLFLFYYFTSPVGRGAIRSIAREMAVSGITGKDLANLVLRVPSVGEQRSIAATLSCLDDKIELNNRIIANLEAQAQAIFKSWFVEFEPFQDGEFEESELGLIPKGWRVGKLGEIAQITSGKRPVDKSEEKTETCVFPIIGASQIMGYTTQVLYSSKIIVTGRVGTHGIIQRFSVPCWPSDNTLVITSEYYEFAYNCLSGIDFKSLNRGSTQPLITQTDIKNTTVIIPPVGILLEFENNLSPLLELVRLKHEESDKLKLTRDALLPKLMSGGIEVPVEG